MNRSRKYGICTQRNFILPQRNEILSFAGKWMELEDIILSEVSQAQKAKSCMFSLICGRQTQYKYNQYYEKQVTLRGGHIREGR
jgi:hypothetical protein